MAGRKGKGTVEVMAGRKGKGTVEVMAGRNKVPVSERALIKRVNRRLAEDGRKLMKNHPARSRKGKLRITKREHQFGTYFVVRTLDTDVGEVDFEVRISNDDLDYADVVEHHLNLEEFARALCVIKGFEFLEIEKTYGKA
jgi:hypothetical protein